LAGLEGSGVFGPPGIIRRPKNLDVGTKYGYGYFVTDCESAQSLTRWSQLMMSRALGDIGSLVGQVEYLNLVVKKQFDAGRGVEERGWRDRLIVVESSKVRIQLSRMDEVLF
jgi:hypothetical protein